MPVQVTSNSKKSNCVGVSTSTMYHPAQTASLEGSYKLEGFEKTQLDEVLDMCADYERQIEAEQKEALRLRQTCTPSNDVSNLGWNDNVNNNSEATTLNRGVSPEQTHPLSKPSLSKICTIYENGGCYQPSTLHQVAPTSPTGNQWSPGGTMITPNR